MKERGLELLVPAGGREQFMAAVQNGADAIYIGGKLFNARAGASNFDDEELRLAVDYAHRYGVRVFVTMNTLLRDEELASALEYAGFLYDTGVDALIVQDLGFGDILHKALPDMELHMSTQATITDALGAAAAHAMGYRRVVLARELSLQEIGEISGTEEVETEVFVHGAICICYSGQCQLSRYYGDRSGNRGSCAQPCRLSYESFDGNDKKLETDTHPMSPKDMCLLEDLGKLAEAGVSSFKIEGRMKSAEYVAIVTSIYRKYLDMYMNKGEICVDEKDRKELIQIFNRGEFTDAYLRSDNGKSLMSGDIAKNQGIKIGKIIGIKQGSTLVDVQLTEEISIGDGIEIYGKNSKVMASTIVSYVKNIGRNKFRIGDIKGLVHLNNEIYRTSRKSQLEKAKDTYKGSSFIPEEDNLKTKKRNPIRLKVYFSEKNDGMFIKLIAETVADCKTLGWPSLEPKAVWTIAGPFETNKENPASIERFNSAFSKTGTTPFYVDKIEYLCENSNSWVQQINSPNIKIKTSELNAIRREVLDKLLEALKFRRKHDEFLLSETIIKNTESTNYWNSRSKDNFELYFNDIKDYINLKNSGELQRKSIWLKDNFNKNIRILLSLAGILSEKLPIGENVIPYISTVTKGREEKILRENYNEVIALGKIHGICVGNLGWLIELISQNLNVIADSGLNVYNQASYNYLLGLGASEVEPSLEAAAKVQGRYPLMSTQHKFKMASLKSRVRQDLKILNRSYSSQSLVLPNLESTELLAQIEKCITENKYRLYI